MSNIRIKHNPRVSFGVKLVIQSSILLLIFINNFELVLYISFSFIYLLIYVSGRVKAAAEPQD